eukprot:TRINITY_DN15385_c0_g1_i1.p1 TRINITY_DN15385_c0_g1~~TRINITY_DN15385_c0_g1_i1.p1  ORF type:complete len:325 (+),score=47.04 TRINITY_DN15385_c0_g1_i1:51-1025(+)
MDGFEAPWHSRPSSRHTSARPWSASSGRCRQVMSLAEYDSTSAGLTEPHERSAPAGECCNGLSRCLADLANRRCQIYTIDDLHVIQREARELERLLPLGNSAQQERQRLTEQRLANCERELARAQEEADSWRRAFRDKDNDLHNELLSARVEGSELRTRGEIVNEERRFQHSELCARASELGKLREELHEANVARGALQAQLSEQRERSCVLEANLQQAARVAEGLRVRNLQLEEQGVAVRMAYHEARLGTGTTSGVRHLKEKSSFPPVPQNGPTCLQGTSVLPPTGSAAVESLLPPQSAVGAALLARNSAPRYPRQRPTTPGG